MLWFQKSHSKYISLGDKNTRFFHISTLNKRRKIKINALKNTDGNWITEKEGIKSIILDYFSDLFRKTDIHILNHWRNIAPNYFTSGDNVDFLKPISNTEI